MVWKRLRLVMLISLAVIVLTAPAFAQSDEEAASGQSAASVVIEVPDSGIGYSEEGDLLLVAVLNNVGETTSPPLNITAVLLNDCIIPSVLQTCRFAAFGVFENVTPDGIEAGESVQWTFNFGQYPDLDLSRWSVIWYQVPVN